MSWSVLGCAYLLDLAVGDPRWLPHPVRGLGWAIRKGESWLRARVPDEIWAGRLLVAGVVLGSWCLVQASLRAAALVSPVVFRVAEVAFLYVCLSTKDLAVESRLVYRALKDGDLMKARRDVSMIVGRDTGELDEREVSRAAVETIAESIMDGIVAPLFYAAIGGVPLCCIYKAVNTLDSMVGYRSARYLRFGRAAAILDRWMNVVPARVTAGLIRLAGWLLGFRPVRAGPLGPRIREENSFIAELAMAEALGVRLGGVNLYQGKPVDTPPMGRERRPLNKERIPETIRVMYTASLLAAVLALGTRFLLGGRLL